MDPELKNVLETVVARLDQIVERLGRIEHELGYPRRVEAARLEATREMLDELEREH